MGWGSGWGWGWGWGPGSGSCSGSGWGWADRVEVLLEVGCAVDHRCAEGDEAREHDRLDRLEPQKRHVVTLHELLQGEGLGLGLELAG